MTNYIDSLFKLQTALEITDNLGEVFTSKQFNEARNKIGKKSCMALSTLREAYDESFNWTSGSFEDCLQTWKNEHKVIIIQDIEEFDMEVIKHIKIFKHTNTGKTYTNEERYELPYKEIRCCKFDHIEERKITIKAQRYFYKVNQRVAYEYLQQLQEDAKEQAAETILKANEEIKKWQDKINKAKQVLSL